MIRKHILTVVVSSPAVGIYSASLKAGTTTQFLNRVERGTWSSNVEILSPRLCKRALLHHSVPQLLSKLVEKAILGPLLYLLVDLVRAF